MTSFPLALIAVAISFGLFVGTQCCEEQRVLKQNPRYETLSGSEAMGVGFDLTASYG